MVKNSLKDGIQKQQFWKQHIEDCSSSGSSQTEYCRQHKLSAKSFTYWKRRFRHKDRSVTFVPLRVNPGIQIATCNSPALVLCKDVYRIEIKEDFKPEVLGQVLRTLREL
jgi:hypothetical protein